MSEQTGYRELALMMQAMGEDLSIEDAAHMTTGFLTGLAYAQEFPVDAAAMDRFIRSQWSLDPTVPQEYGPEVMAKAIKEKSGGTGLVVP